MKRLEIFCNELTRNCSKSSCLIRRIMSTVPAFSPSSLRSNVSLQSFLTIKKLPHNLAHLIQCIILNIYPKKFQEEIKEDSFCFLKNPDKKRLYMYKQDCAPHIDTIGDRGKGRFFYRSITLWRLYMQLCVRQCSS